jgi:glutamate formiminotransferase
MLECVVNISEGRNEAWITAVAARAGDHCLDVHSDPWHNRSVLTLAGPDVLEAAFDVTKGALDGSDFAGHDGVHPAIGTVDVVPFTPLGEEGFGERTDLTRAIEARNAFARRVGDDLGIPCFLYGPERTLPEIRSGAFGSLAPDRGPLDRHPSAGGCCVGARPSLIAYNVYLEDRSIATARSVAREIRSPEVRALGLLVGDGVQVSCNLVAPWRVGPAGVVDQIRELAKVARTELVGLIPDAVLGATHRSRWAELDLDPDCTIEAHLHG